ncbi:MAG: SlyX family protein [Planctomycetaceae bacterium]
MPKSDTLTERLIRLENAVAHLQHDLEQMHAVLLAQTAENDALHKQVQRLQGQIERIEQGPELRDPESERPPHY